MCYNCGCGIKSDPMGKGEVQDGGGSLTEKTFEHMAKLWGMSVDQAKVETLRMLKQELESKDSK